MLGFDVVVFVVVLLDLVSKVVITSLVVDVVFLDYSSLSLLNSFDDLNVVAFQDFSLIVPFFDVVELVVFGMLVIPFS